MELISAPRPSYRSSCSKLTQSGDAVVGISVSRWSAGSLRVGCLSRCREKAAWRCRCASAPLAAGGPRGNTGCGWLAPPLPGSSLALPGSGRSSPGNLQRCMHIGPGWVPDQIWQDAFVRLLCDARQVVVHDKPRVDCAPDAVVTCGSATSGCRDHHFANMASW